MKGGWNISLYRVVATCSSHWYCTCITVCNAVFTYTKYICSKVLTIKSYVSECSHSWTEFHDLPPALLASNMRQVYVQDTQVNLQKRISSNLKFSKGGLPPLRGIPPSRMPGAFKCPGCGKSYWYKKTMLRHLRLECGKEPQFQCPYCPHRAKQKNHLVKHIASRHKDAV
jgi:hypothetical protein